MDKSKLILVLALAIAVSVTGLIGCATPKQPPVQQPAPQVTKPPEPKPAPAPAPRIQEPPKRVEEKVTVPADLRFDTVYFDFDKSDIRSDQRSSLNRNAELLSRYQTVRIQIEGHCDERGTDAYNIALGDRRAESARRYLIDYGISSSRITTVSYGESRPVDSGHNETAWSKNRRCEFIITSK